MLRLYLAFYLETPVVVDAKPGGVICSRNSAGVLYTLELGDLEIVTAGCIFVFGQLLAEGASSVDAATGD